jgi:transposase-like protein
LQLANRAIYLAVGVNLQGRKEVLGFLLKRSETLAQYVSKQFTQAK